MAYIILRKRDEVHQNIAWDYRRNEFNFRAQNVTISAPFNTPDVINTWREYVGNGFDLRFDGMGYLYLNFIDLNRQIQVHSLYANSHHGLNRNQCVSLNPRMGQQQLCIFYETFLMLNLLGTRGMQPTYTKSRMDYISQIFFDQNYSIEIVLDDLKVKHNLPA